MIIHSLKKFTAVVLTGSVIFGLAGCLNFGGNKAVIEAADELASQIADADASKLIKNSTLDKKSKEAQSLTELLSADFKSDDELAFYKAVEATIEYEIDEKSCSVSKGEASVDIVFTIADYESVLKEEFTKIDELTSAIKKADTKEITFTAEFVKEDKEWVADNVGSKKFLKIYDYRNAEIKLALTADMIAGFIDRNFSEFWLTSDDKYTDTDFIEYDYYFDSAVYDYEDRGVYLSYELQKDNVTLYSGGSFLFGSSTNFSCRVDSSMAGYGYGEYFESGKYKLILKMPDGTEIDSETVEVEKNEVVLPTGNPSGGGATLSGEGDYFDFYDPNFKNYVISAEWFDYDGCMTNDYTYTTDVKTIAFSIQVTSDYKEPLLYSFSYATETSQDAIREALDNPIYTETVLPKEYTNGYFYDIDYAVNGDAKPGYYMLVISVAGTDSYIMYGYCYVS